MLPSHTYTVFGAWAWAGAVNVTVTSVVAANVVAVRIANEERLRMIAVDVDKRCFMCLLLVIDALMCGITVTLRAAESLQLHSASSNT
jgi:hypothetical protein